MNAAIGHDGDRVRSFADDQRLANVHLKISAGTALSWWFEH